MQKQVTFGIARLIRSCGRAARAPGTHAAQSLEPGATPAPPARTRLNHWSRARRPRPRHARGSIIAFRYKGGRSPSTTCKTGDRRNYAPHTVMRARRPRTRHARGSIIGVRRDARAPGTHVTHSLGPGATPAPPARTWLNHFAFRYRGGRSPSAFNVQPSTRNLPRATFNVQPSTCNLQLSTAISGRNASDQRHP